MQGIRESSHCAYEYRLNDCKVLSVYDVNAIITFYVSILQPTRILNVWIICINIWLILLRINITTPILRTKKYKTVIFLDLSLNI